MPELLPRVFFSYARSDADFVLEVCKALRAEGRSVWVDQLDIPKGARWDEEVEKALKSSNCLLVVLSPASVQSHNVQDEVSYALEEGRSVLPILLQDCDIPFRLKRLQYIDFTGDSDQAYQELSAALATLGAAGGGSHSSDAKGGPEQAAVPQPARAPVRGPVASGEAPWRASRRQGFRTYAAVGVLALAAVVVGAWWAGADPVAPNAVAPDGAQVQQPSAGTTLSEAQAREFVLRYISLENDANIAGLLSFYAEHVDYFSEGRVGQDFIFKDKQAYYRRWPQVDNRLKNAVTVAPIDASGSGVRVSYVLSYRVSHPARNETRTGATLNELLLQKINQRWYIVGQKQQVAPGSSGNIN